jgi:flavodoxin
MSSTIYYFSATGNSLEIACQISKELKDSTMKSMTTELPKKPVGGSNEIIGFVFPVYYLGMPVLVKKFVEKLEILPGTYCFAVTNFARISDNTLGMLEKIIQRKDIQLSYAEEVKMPTNYIVSYPPPNPDKLQEILKKERSKLIKLLNPFPIIHKNQLKIIYYLESYLKI